MSNTITTQTNELNNTQSKTMSFEELKAIVQRLSVLDNEGEVNLTPIAKLFGKRIDKWKQSCADIIEEIQLTQNGVVENSTLRTKEGNNGGGTFTNNPDVFLEFLRYCSPKIAVAMTRVVRELFEGRNPLAQPKELSRMEILTMALEIEKENQLLLTENKQKQGEILKLAQDVQNTRTTLAKHYKTVDSRNKADLGNSINRLINKHFIVEGETTYRDANHASWNAYYSATGINYYGAKNASYEEKLSFLNFLTTLS